MYVSCGHPPRYIFTYFFKSHSTAQNVVLLVNLMVFLMLLVSIIMGNLEKVSSLALIPVGNGVHCC